jgi:hypothetical protein
MESLMKDAKRDLDFKIVDAKEEELEEGAGESQVAKDLTQMMMQIKGMEGQKMIQMNTTALENKINAVQIISSLAQVLGPIFIDFVEPVAKLIVDELIHDKLSSTVRKEAARTCAVLLNCVPDQ